MKFLHRSVSNYEKPQKSNDYLPRRQVSVPSILYQQDLYDEADLSPQVANVRECINDAAGLLSKVSAILLRSPGIVDPDYTPQNFHPVLTDAEYLLPVISHLVTYNHPDGLPLVRDILMRMQKMKPNIQYLGNAVHAVKNAILLLRLDDNDAVNMNTLITQPRDFIAAAMIVNKYLKNLTSDHSQLL